MQIITAMVAHALWLTSCCIALFFGTAVSSDLAPVIQKVAKSKGGDCTTFANVIHEASGEDLPPRYLDLKESSLF